MRPIGRSDELFTGIVEEVGRIEDILLGSDRYTLKVSGDIVLEDTRIGDSISTNGVCLTVTNLEDGCFYADVMKETISKTSLNNLAKGSKVNLERALTLNTRLGGHIVTGHIDGVGKILSRERDGNAVWFTIGADDSILKYVIYKGSIALDGISLTVADLDDISFKVSIIPHTESETTLLDRMVGDEINIECDVLGKYVERLLGFRDEGKVESRIDMNFLAENGFV